MLNTGMSEGEESKASESPTSPKTNQIDLERCKIDYVNSNWKSITELSRRYNIKRSSLDTRIINEKWEDERQSNLVKLRKTFEQKKVNIGEEYLKKTFLRAEKWTNLIDKSLEQSAELLEPDQLNQLSLVEARTHELAKSALRISDHKTLDVTSKGQSIGESIFSALDKIRATDKTPELTEADCDRILECEIVDEKDKL